MKISHNIYYLIELAILACGFFVVFILGYNFHLQMISLILVLAVYSIFGIVHHKVHHNLHKKIIAEYILISLLILTMYLFLNIGKL